MARMSIQDRAAAVGMVQAGSSLRQVRSVKIHFPYNLPKTKFTNTTMLIRNGLCNCASFFRSLYIFNELFRPSMSFGPNVNEPEMCRTSPDGLVDASQLTAWIDISSLVIYRTDLRRLPAPLVEQSVLITVLLHLRRFVIVSERSAFVHIDLKSALF